MTKNKLKMKTIIAWVILSITMLFSQNVVYSTNNHSMQLFEDSNQQIVQLADDISESQISECIDSLTDVQLVKGFGINYNLYLLEKTNLADWLVLKSYIQNSIEVVRWIPAYYYS